MNTIETLASVKAVTASMDSAKFESVLKTIISDLSGPMASANEIAHFALATYAQTRMEANEETAETAKRAFGPLVKFAKILRSAAENKGLTASQNAAAKNVFGALKGYLAQHAGLILTASKNDVTLKCEMKDGKFVVDVKTADWKTILSTDIFERPETVQKSDLEKAESKVIAFTNAIAKAKKDGDSGYETANRAMLSYWTQKVADLRSGKTSTNAPNPFASGVTTKAKKAA